MANTLISNFHLWTWCPFQLLQHITTWYYSLSNRQLLVYSCDSANHVVIWHSILLSFIWSFGVFFLFLISSIYVAIEIIMSPQTSSTKILKGSSTLKTHSVPLPEGSKCCLALYREGRSTSHSTDIWTGSTMLQSLWKNYFLFFIHLFVHISLKTASQINQIRKA